MKKVKTEDVEILANKAMAEVKETGKKMLEVGIPEKLEFRRKAGLDEGGHPLKGVDPLTGEAKPKQKRGRKPKSETVIYTGEAPKEKAPKTTIKKKEKGEGATGRVASAPVLLFDNVKDTSLEAKTGFFDNAMGKIFGEKYDGKKLLIDNLSLVVKKSVSRPTAKNPNGVFVVELEGDSKTAKFYEWANKFYMSQLVNYSHYMKPTK